MKKIFSLKDQAKLIVNAVGDYLKGMSLSDPEHYADSYTLFCVTIESANQSKKWLLLENTMNYSRRRLRKGAAFVAFIWNRT